MVPTLITFGYNYAIVFHANQRLSPGLPFFMYCMMKIFG